MKCPTCDDSLKEIDVGGILVDVCETKCGGIWFDNYEFKKFDEPHEHDGEALLEYSSKEGHQINKEEKHKCPKCDDVVMRRHFLSVKHEVEIDECSGCGGIWLDAGELGRIRNQYQTEEKRGQAAEKYFSEVFDADLMKVREESQEQLAKAKRFANMFKFITPSYYIPGKQEGGAF